jgi:transposase
MDVPVCQGCRERDARIAELERRVAELETLVRDLMARLGQNASNSSLPPSANPPGAPKPVQKKKSGRKPGGQPGHPPHLRQLLPPDRVSRTIRFVPKYCQACAAPLSAAARPNDPEPKRHQVAELPELTAIITEYQSHARTCTECGQVTWEAIPAAIRAQSCGPRLAATMAYLVGCHHLSKRGVEEVVETVFAAPMSLGTVASLEQEMSAALAPAHAEAVQAVQQADVKHVDETGWKKAGAKRWLWMAATKVVAAFLIHTHRSALAMAQLLGERIHGIICSDRWWTYNGVALGCRQVCWAHLKRDFQKCVDRGGAAAESVGEAGLRIVACVFKAWHSFRGGGCTREGLQEQLMPVTRRLHRVLRQGRACPDRKVARFCTNLLALEPALWTFVCEEGVEPTNNHAERVLRQAVLWRKNAFGCHSDNGCRFVERILTVVQTLRLQQRPVLAFLFEALVAHRSGRKGPQLVLQG